jgi:hypothetical protein
LVLKVLFACTNTSVLALTTPPTTTQLTETFASQLLAFVLEAAGKMGLQGVQYVHGRILNPPRQSGNTLRGV